MDEVTLKIAQIEKVRDRINQYIADSVYGARCLDDIDVGPIQNTVAEYFRDLTGDTQPIDLETMKPCEPSLRASQQVSFVPPHIVIEVRGGCVVDVTADGDFTHEIKDYDNDPDLDDKDA